MNVVRRAPAEERSETREGLALAAALVHDVGHGPFSHAFEDVGRRLGLKLAHHEEVSDRLIRDSEITKLLNDDLGGGAAIDIADMVKSEGKITVHNAIVSSQFDADRLDYMRRDRLMTGTQHSAIDFSWLIANLEFGDVPSGVDEEQIGQIRTFVIGPKAIHAAESYVLGLFQLYPTVYFHKATRGAEKLFAELLVRVIQLTRDGSGARTGLPDGHPILRFATAPDDLENVLSLDDTVMWGAVAMMARADDPLIEQFSSRLRDRKLLKCIDIVPRIAHEFDPECSGDPERQDRIERCCATIYEKLMETSEAKIGEIPPVLVDQDTRSPYKDAGGQKGPTERINVWTDGNQLVDLKQRSRIVAALTDYALLRAYHDRENEAVRASIEKIIKSEVEACRPKTRKSRQSSPTPAVRS